MGSAPVIRVAVIDDHPLFRDGLVGQIDEAPDVELTGAYPSVESFDASGRPVDVVILDLHLPGRTGSDAVAHLTAAGCRVLVLSGATAAHEVRGALDAGALGYIGKDSTGDDVLAAVETVARGDTHLAPILASVLLADRSSRPPLSPREREVLSLLAEGATDWQIAKRLYISVRTVHTHIDRIRAKTGCRRRVELARFATDRDANSTPRPRHV